MIQLPGYQPVASTSLLPAASGDAAAAPARSLLSVAQGIGGIGEVVGGMASDLLRVDNGCDLSEGRRTLDRNYATFQLTLENETDPQARLEKTNTFLQSQRDQLFNPDHAPVVKQALQNHIAEFSVRALNAAERDAANLRIRRATLAFQNEVDDAKRLAATAPATARQNFERAKTTATDALGLLPEEIQRMDADFDRSTALLGITNLIFENPLEAKEELEAEGFVERTPGIAEADRIGFLKKADAEISMLERESMKRVSDLLNRGEIVTESELDEAIKDNPVLDEGYKDELRFSLTQKTPVDADTRFALVDSLNDLHDSFKAGEMSVEDYRAAHDELARAVYALGARDGAGALRQRVHALDPAAWSDDSAGKRKLKEMDKAKTLLRSVELISKLYATQDAFGDIDEDAEPGERAAQAVDAQQRRLRIEAEMGKWISQNPESTEEEVSTQYRKTYMNRLTARYWNRGHPPRQRGGGGCWRNLVWRETKHPAATTAPKARAMRSPPSRSVGTSRR